MASSSACEIGPSYSSNSSFELTNIACSGIFFSAFMILLSYIQARYTNYKPSSSEEFTSASRSVKPGLIASGIVSAWTWAATLLTSSAQAYKYGIAGPWW
jgi:Na+/proline symporter